MGTTAEKLQAILDAKTAIKTAINQNSASKVGDNLSTYATAVSGIRSSLVDVIQGKANTVITAEDLKGATAIRDYAFVNCSSLTSIIIPNSVTSIGKSAFTLSSGLTSVTIPDSVTSIGENAFSECSGLTSVTIPNNVTNINQFTFYNCTGLNSITIPASITSIGKNAFYGCTGLTSITCLATNPPSISSNSFSLTNGCPIYVPVGSVDAYKSATNWSSIGIRNRIQPIPSQGLAFSSNGDGTCAVTGLGTCTDTALVIPTKSPDGDTVTSIGYRGFAYCYALTSVTIPESVTSISDYAFYYCSSLTSVTIPDGVTNIGNGVFYQCSSLTSVTIPGSIPSIGEHSFAGCSKLTSVTIPNSVTSIGYGAFDGCTCLTSITIGNGVTNIDSEAFYYCKNLVSVTLTALMPPIIENDSFYETNNCPIYVPTESVDAYKSAENWSEYESRIQAIPQE